ncbi:hypothetical protein CZ814_01319 [Photobacterium toruni]|uniref:Uncharacterized protein n=2 Tax=Photobacterium toruni TaxID=1935446 RepID=A0A1T4RHB7_9GAMM|nr:hypothetical protein CZ814_01319 [Photobacterium toruni]
MRLLSFLLYCIMILATELVLASPIKTVIKLSPLPITQHNVELPLNEYTALEVLILKKVSSSQVPRPYDIPSTALLATNNNEVTDINHNNIRDDYERLLLIQYQRPEYIAMAILAAAHWDRLIATYSQSERITSITALALMTNNIAINQCYYSLQQIDNTLTSPILNYFDTEQKLTIKNKAEAKLLAIIASSPFSITFDVQPCQRFTLLAEAMLKTTLVSL